MARTKAELHPAARLEVRQATIWYRAEASPAVAARFRDEIRATISRIKANPHAGAAVDDEIDPTGRTRRRMVRTFPYLVFYLVDGAVIRIVAVAHVKQEPGYWANRVP